MKNFYDTFMKPLERRGILNARKNLIPRAKGVVLEIGAGTGANLKHYNLQQVEKIILTDLKINKNIVALSNKIEVMEMNVESIPFPDDTFDCIVHTLVFCSVYDIEKGLQEIKRVLKPSGSILFVEHILPEKKGLRNLFRFVNPAWKTIASGCNLTRDYESSLLDNGFQIVQSSKFMNTVFVYGEAKKVIK